MEKEDLAIVTKALASDFDDFITKLSSDVNVEHTDDVTAPSTLLADVNKAPKGSSFVSVLQDMPRMKTVKLDELRNTKVVEGAAIAIPFEVVKEVSSQFANTLYGYFIGKRLAFPLMENFVKNTWTKYGLKRVMLDDSFFLFQFKTKEGKYEEWPVVDQTCSIVASTDNDGFTLVKKKKKKKAMPARQVDGIRFTKLSLNLHYRRIEKGESSSAQHYVTPGSKPNVPNDVNEVGKERIVSNVSTSPLKSGSFLNTIEVPLKNSFDSINEE
ncbi:hypothetical protein Tco_1279093, partial [Tanacetum coccineum]